MVRPTRTRGKKWAVQFMGMEIMTSEKARQLLSFFGRTSAELWAIKQNVWFWSDRHSMGIVIDLKIFQLRSDGWERRGSFCTELRINLLFCVAGVRPGSRATFVSAKVAQTIDAPSGLMKWDRRQAREGEPTRCAQTRLVDSWRASIQRAGRQASDDKNDRVFKESQWPWMDGLAWPRKELFRNYLKWDSHPPYTEPQGRAHNLRGGQSGIFELPIACSNRSIILANMEYKSINTRIKLKATTENRWLTAKKFIGRRQYHSP